MQTTLLYADHTPLYTDHAPFATITTLTSRRRQSQTTPPLLLTTPYFMQATYTLCRPPPFMQTTPHFMQAPPTCHKKAGLLSQQRYPNNFPSFMQTPPTDPTLYADHAPFMQTTPPFIQTTPPFMQAPPTCRRRRRWSPSSARAPRTTRSRRGRC